MRYKMTFKGLSAFLVALVCVVITLLSGVSAVGEVVDGDTVYIDDSKLYMSATPHTSYGEDVVIDLQSKVFSGNVNLLFLYPSDTYRPSGLSLWNPNTFTNSNGTVEVIGWEKANFNTQKFERELWGSNWTIRLAENLYVNQAFDYRAKVSFDYSAVSPDEEVEKYWICIYPSSYGYNVRAANLNDHLYCLDPWTGPPPTGGEAYYDMEEGSGTTLNDVWNNNDMTLSGTYTFDSNVPTFNQNGDGDSYSLRIDDSNAYAQASSQLINTNGFTISAWVYINVNNDFLGYFGTSNSAGTRDGIRLFYFDNNDEFATQIYDSGTSYLSTNTYSSIGSATTIETWYHVVSIYDGSNNNISTYTNGVLTSYGTGPNAGTWTHDTFPQIGRGFTDQLDNNLDGLIDEVQIYDYVLNSTEVLTLYNNGSSAPSAPVSSPFLITASSVVDGGLSSFSADVSSPPDCYQESVDVSTACGGLGTGTKSVSGTWSLIAKTYDGDYGTNGYVSTGTGYLYLNYSKPKNYSEKSLWQIKAGNVPSQIYENATIPDSCWDYHPDNLILRVSSSASNTHGDCYNGSWITITSNGGQGLFEEGIWWSFYDSYSTTNGTIYTNINNSDSSLINVKISDVTNHFDKNYTDLNISNDLSASLDKYPEINIFNKWDSTAITGFTATIDSVEYTTTGTSLYVPVNDSSVTVWVNKTDYITIADNMNLTPNGVDNNTYLYQSIITLKGYELISSSLLSGVSFSTNGTAGFLIYPNAANGYNVTATKTGYYDKSLSFNVSALDVKTVNVTGMYDTIINITAYDNWTASSIDNFTLTTINNNYSWSDVQTTTSGEVLIPAVQGLSYTSSISIPNSFNPDSYTYTPSESTYNYTFNLEPYNSVNITFKDFDNESTIDFETINITLISNGTANNYNTSTGNLTLTLLAPSSYELRTSVDGYIDRNYFFTVTNQSASQITIYLVANVSTELQKIRILDTTNTEITGAIVRVEKETTTGSNLWTNYAEETTNAEGIANTYLEKGINNYYRFSVFYNGAVIPIYPSGNDYTVKTNFIAGVSEVVDIVINLQSIEIKDYYADLYSVSTNMGFFNNDTVWFSWLDAQNTISGAKLVIRGKYIDNTTAYEVINTQTSSATSGNLSFTFTPINNTIYQVYGYIVYSDHDAIAETATKTYGVTSFVEKNTGLLLAILILSVTAVLTVSFGVLISGVMTVLMLVFTNIIGLTNFPTTIITSLLALFIILMIRITKGDEG